jgi:hypothetical protein
MNLGELRELIKDLPDDYEIVTSPGDATWWEVTARPALTPAAGAPGLLILDDGQEVTEQYWIPIRTGIETETEAEYDVVPADWEYWDGNANRWRAVGGFSWPPAYVVRVRPPASFWEGSA